MSCGRFDLLDVDRVAGGIEAGGENERPAVVFLRGLLVIGAKKTSWRKDPRGCTCRRFRDLPGECSHVRPAIGVLHLWRRGLPLGIGRARVLRESQAGKG